MRLPSIRSFGPTVWGIGLFLLLLAGSAPRIPVFLLTLVIGLPKHQIQTKSRTSFVATLLDLGERGATVKMRFALSQQIQVGAIQNMDAVQCHLPRDRSGQGHPRSRAAPDQAR